MPRMWGCFCVALAAIAPTQPKYDPASVVRISGAIEEVREVETPRALKGIHVTLRVDKRSIEIFVAPAGFLKTFELNLTRGDEISVRGSKIRFGGADLVLAQELRKDNAILVLRDEAGNPYWEDEVFKSVVGKT